jgi:hypothetical protein
MSNNRDSIVSKYTINILQKGGGRNHNAIHSSTEAECGRRNIQNRYRVQMSFFDNMRKQSVSSAMLAAPPRGAESPLSIALPQKWKCDPSAVVAT